LNGLSGLAAVVLLCLAAAGCGASGSGEDTAGLDAASDGTGDVPGDAPDSGGADGVAEIGGTDETAETTDGASDTVQPLMPRAFLVESDADLLQGRQAVGRVGDYRIDNGRIAAIIGGPDHSLWGPYGGGVLDLAPAGVDDHFEEHFPVAGFLRSVRAESILVVKDGSDGEAVIRVTGKDGPIPLIASLAPLMPANVDATVDYVLAAGADCLTIRTTLSNPGDTEMTLPVGDGVVFSETGRTFGSGAGFDVPGLIKQGNVDWIGSDDVEVSFLLAPAKGVKMSLALSEQELNALLYDSVVIPPGESRTVERCLYAVPGRSLGALNRFWEERGLSLVQVEGSAAIDTPGFDRTRLSLEITGNGGKFTGAANPDAAGAFAFKVPVGKYTATLSGQGFLPVSETFDAVLGETAGPLDLDPADPGRLDVQVEDGSGKGVPARVTVQAGADAGFFAGRVGMLPTLDGKATFFLPAGDYTVQGSSGPEWSVSRVNATVVAGSVVEATCGIQHEVDTAGWLAGDGHNHSEFGIDSQMLREDRVKAEASEGLDLWVGTDHDIFTDFAPVVNSLGAADLLVAVVGNEVSPVGRHFNGLSCTPAAEDMLKYFVVPWVYFTPAGEVGGNRPEPEIWKTMHEEFGCRVVQLNHPRDGQGYFDFVGFDPEVGPSSADPKKFDLTFDAIEVWNSGASWDEIEALTMPDWYSFLNRGHAKVATGNPDSHELDSWAGQPRNLVLLSQAVTPGDATGTEKAFFDALLAFRSQVTSAPFVTFSVDGKDLGSTVVPGPDGSVEIAVRVDAASWVPLDTVRLMGNGEVVEEWDVSGASGVVRLEATLELLPVADTWYHVVAFDKDETLAPVYPGRSSLSFTNPIWVDLAGDGFDPPIED
jgi:hypothetical protein